MTGDEDVLARRRLVFALLRFTILHRSSLALTDDAVCPLSKKEWRNFTSGSVFQHAWPKDSLIPYKIDHLQLFGNDKIWGKDLTTQAKAAYEAGRPCPIQLDTLDCGCHPNTINWRTDTAMKLSVILHCADNEFFEELCLLDPALCASVHAAGTPEHPHHPAILPPSDALEEWDGATARRWDLAVWIVWNNKYGDGELHGWELEDLIPRRRWVGWLEEYLGTLWRQDIKAKEFGSLRGYSAEDVTGDAIRKVSCMAELLEYEQALLQYFHMALQRDHGYIPTPFFHTTEAVRGPWRCPSCREVDASSA